ncbi:MAG: histone deacetylase [Gammaproteobacteria bacterium]
MRTGLVYDDRFREHDTGPHHPEAPARLDAAVSAIKAAAWHDELTPVATRAADIADVERCHALTYIRRARAACAANAPFLDTMDVAISAKSWDIALLAAGAPLALADALVDGVIDNGFALVRPPGHHAEHASAMGFCLFNNVAILARYLQHTHGMDKIAILDWDVHHGNGTQHSFDQDPSVLYVSLHQYPYFPGSGAYDETGTGRGAGTTLNCPLPAGATDSAYERAFHEQVIPKIDLFKPECIIVSAGFDAHRDDPLADMQLSTGMYAWMTERVLECADSHAGGRVLSVLEGGYHLDRLGECVAVHLGGLLGAPATR